MKLAKAAYIVAFVIAGLSAIAAYTQIITLPFALIPLMAGIGIVRKRVWSAYGFALFQFARLLVVPIILLRSGPAIRDLPEIIGGAVILAALVVFFLFAGRALKAAGCERGPASPWIAVSA